MRERKRIYSIEIRWLLMKKIIKMSSSLMIIRNKSPIIKSLQQLISKTKLEICYHPLAFRRPPWARWIMQVEYILTALFPPLT
jgi:hypothetical protein